jgi:AraC-like DNA-binding protein
MASGMVRIVGSGERTGLNEAADLGMRVAQVFVEPEMAPGRALIARHGGAAVESFNHGHEWTDAAHRAGFADSAHLSRTFRRMFGISPVMLIRQ